MKLTIAKKLALSFLLLTIIVLAATLGLARWSFERGFLDYINTLEQVRLDAIAQVLSKEFADHGYSWNNLSPAEIGHIIQRTNIKLNNDAKIDPDTSRARYRQPQKDSMERPPHMRHRPPPGDHQGPPQRPRPQHQQGKRSPGPGMRPKTSLFSPTGEFIAGDEFDQSEETISAAIIVAGKEVALLKTTPRRHIRSPQEAAFSKQQLITSLTIGLISLCLAGAVAWILTKILIAPIRELAGGLRTIARGHYGARLETTRQDELGELMDNLDHLAFSLEQAQSSRRRWIASISHELRTPVTVLAGEINAIQDGIRPLDMNQINSLDQEVNRLQHLIDDLYQLSLTDIGGLKYAFENLDLVECLEHPLQIIEPIASEKSIRIQQSIQTKTQSCFIHGDQHRIAQLLINLLRNSLAYTDGPGTIQITLSQEARQAILQIEDTAPGVPLSECTTLFEPLYRREGSRNRWSGGAGLGLTICKQIVEAHKGSISARPSALGGIIMEIRLPLA